MSRVLVSFPNSTWVRVLCGVALCVFASSLWSAEKVLLHLPGGKYLRCDVLKITKSDVTVKGDGEREQTLPFGLLEPKEVYECYKQIVQPDNGAMRLDMATFLLKKALYDEAKTELLDAAKADPKLKGRVDELLKTVPSAAPAKVATPEPKKPATPPADKPAPKDKHVASADRPSMPSGPPPPPGFAGPMMGDGKDGMSGYEGDGPPRDSDFQKRFMRGEVPARNEAQMKEFLDKRLEELNTVVGGKWRLIETKHYYCFANLPEVKHTFVANKWNEPLYEMLCKILRHKDGDKLWNNKLPIYYFETFRQFQKFAVEIDKSPGGAYSGGYFASRGRDVHICIPFMSERLKSSPNRMDEMARSTMCHEGTHAFLQLTGEDVPLSKWLHEGMAQFIEFLFDEPKNPDKRDTIARLKNAMLSNKGNPPAWEETKERPAGGTDVEGYALAYGKLFFLYQNFDHQCLPEMVKSIKSGMSEKDAMEKVFKVKLSILEDYYRGWVKEAVKTNFNFPPPSP